MGEAKRFIVRNQARIGDNMCSVLPTLAYVEIHKRLASSIRGTALIFFFLSVCPLGLKGLALSPNSLLSRLQAHVFAPKSIVLGPGRRIVKISPFVRGTTALWLSKTASPPGTTALCLRITAPCPGTKPLCLSLNASIPRYDTLKPEAYLGVGGRILFFFLLI